MAFSKASSSGTSQAHSPARLALAMVSSSRRAGGTLFIDEIADMPARMQLDLLRVLQESRVRPVGAAEERPVDVRIVAASKRPLQELSE